MASRLTHAELDRLFDAVAATDATTGAGEPNVMSALYQLLGFDGQPVTPARLAATVGWEETRSRQLLDRLPNVELDEHGSVVGFGGLTLRPTPHEIVFDRQMRYAWCAWDTLFLPVALGTEVAVRSHCPQTGRPITLTVSPTGVADRDPEGAVLSFVQPDAVDVGDLRASFCSAVQFLSDPAAAARWNANNADRLVLDLDDAFELGRRMIVNRCGCCAPHTTRDRKGQ